LTTTTSAASANGSRSPAPLSDKRKWWGPNVCPCFSCCRPRANERAKTRFCDSRGYRGGYHSQNQAWTSPLQHERPTALNLWYLSLQSLSAQTRGILRLVKLTTVSVALTVFLRCKSLDANERQPSTYPLGICIQEENGFFQKEMFFGPLVGTCYAAPRVRQFLFVQITSPTTRYLGDDFNYESRTYRRQRRRQATRR
jgi:hypothetical protein